MILPDKYISNSESLLGISSFVLSVLKAKTLPIETIWKDFQKKYIHTMKLKNPPTYQKFILTINFMYIAGMVNYSENGMIFNENIKAHH
ncbi:ABC-three component system middle component 6 [Sporosarcina sp. FSL K6-6792]|uniref:ABC-three component system middle component 6 n=1 Tax=Sporosarcina sp. FSL K6-6792 TaxID=2921559 RepID=UPI0030F9F4D7